MPSKQSNKLEVFFWITFWKFETLLSEIDSGNPASTFRENVFDYRDKTTTRRTFGSEGSEYTYE